MSEKHVSYNDEMLALYNDSMSKIGWLSNFFVDVTDQELKPCRDCGLPGRLTYKYDVIVKDEFARLVTIECLGCGNHSKHGLWIFADSPTSHQFLAQAIAVKLWNMSSCTLS